jgi:cell wall-associated NlpC family hydrolase
VHALAELNGNTDGAMTRREAREAFDARTGGGAMRRHSPAQPPANPGPDGRAAKPRRRLKSFANVFVLLAAAGIVGTIAIPAYAFNPSTQAHAAASSAVIDTMKRTDAQSADVATDAAAPVAGHDDFQATSVAELASAKKSAVLAAAAKAAAAKAVSYTAAYSGPSAADYLANPPYPNFSLAQVFAVAQQYAGVPYQYGGSTPAGFDCSGFVMFVYAQFGISLPHSSAEQGHIGKTISLADAVPGDVIALNDGSHVGFYAGTNSSGQVMIFDAPHEGGVVGLRALWTTAYHIQRFGI